MIVCPFCSSQNDDKASVCRVCGASLQGAKYPTALAVGTTLQGGKYRIDGVLGQGGFGITYKAYSTALDIPVALKEFHPQGASRAGTSLRPPGTLTQSEFSQARQRFADEARVVARLTYATPNAHIVRVYDVFTENDTEYYAMEFLEGKPLSSVVAAQGPFPEADVLVFARQLVDALEDVHAAGLLHRDVKPDNVILTKRGAVLIDFGSARAMAAGGRASIIITPGYAPLEQYASEAKRGPFTDVYALAGTLYFALTAVEPVPATDRAAGANQPSARELNGRVSVACSSVLERAMRMRVDERPQTAKAFLAELEVAAAVPTPPRAAFSSSQAPQPPVPPVPQGASGGPQPRSNPRPSAPPRLPRASPGAAPPVASPRNSSPPSPTPSAVKGSGGGCLLFLWVVCGILLIVGEWRGVSSLVLLGLYGAVALAVISVLSWLGSTRFGRVVLGMALVGGIYFLISRFLAR